MINEYDCIALARKSTDAILQRYFNMPIAKGYDVNSPSGFAQSILYLAGELQNATARNDSQALQEIMRVCDVDWRALSRERRRLLISHAMSVAQVKVHDIPQRIAAQVGLASNDVVRSTRDYLRTSQRLTIAADFNAIDRRMIDYLRRTQSVFVRDEYGRRMAAVEERVRNAVADGLEAGLGHSDIAEKVEQAASLLTSRSRVYWDLVAGSVIGQGRTYSQISGYHEARIRHYQIHAVMDEATTLICRHLNGKVFTVKEGVERLAALESSDDVAAIKAQHPWVYERRSASGEQQELFVRQGGERVGIATYGAKDDRLQDGARRDDELSGLGVSFPPFHALCRSTTVPA